MQQSKIFTAKIAVKVPLPVKLVDKMKKEEEELTRILDKFDYPYKPKRFDWDKEAWDFADKIDTTDVRDAIRRKAKKLKLEVPSGMFPVHYDIHNYVVELYYWTRK